MTDALPCWYWLAGCLAGLDGVDAATAGPTRAPRAPSIAATGLER